LGRRKIMKKFEFLEHTADLKFRAFGKNKEKVFENCAVAYSSVISRGKKIEEKVMKKIIVKGKDIESLLYNFLEELIFLLDSKSFVVSMTKVKIGKGKLYAQLWGDIAGNYKGLDHVKAVTYSEMYVKEVKKGKWEAQVVLDV
jgi:SHS2 domain-containing protein